MPPILASSLLTLHRNSYVFAAIFMALEKRRLSKKFPSNKYISRSWKIKAVFASLEALITFFFIRPLSADCMTEEDRAFRAYLEENGFDTSIMGVGEDEESETDSIEREKEKVAVGEEEVDVKTV